MLMIFFNKHGGSFYVEAGRISDQRFLEQQQLWANAGNSLAESALTVGHCHPNQRARLGPNGFLSGKDHWFVFGPDNLSFGVNPQQSASYYDGIAAQVVSWLKQHATPFFVSAP